MSNKTGRSWFSFWVGRITKHSRCKSDLYKRIIKIGHCVLYYKFNFQKGRGTSIHFQEQHQISFESLFSYYLTIGFPWAVLLEWNILLCVRSWILKERKKMYGTWVHCCSVSYWLLIYFTKLWREKKENHYIIRQV